MGKAEENKKHKRSALLTHAFSLFMSKGISKTTISDIAEQAGVGKGTFYFYFKDKEELIEKLIAQKAEQLFMHAVEALQSKDNLEDSSVEGKLIFIVNDLIDQLRLDIPLFKFINKNLNYGIYKRALSNENVHPEFDIIASYHELIESDGSNWRSPELMLYTIVELVCSTCYSIIIDGEPVDIDTYKPYLFMCIRSIIQSFRIQ